MWVFTLWCFKKQAYVIVVNLKQVCYGPAGYNQKKGEPFTHTGGCLSDIIKHV